MKGATFRQSKKEGNLELQTVVEEEKTVEDETYRLRAILDQSNLPKQDTFEQTMTGLLAKEQSQEEGVPDYAHEFPEIKVDLIGEQSPRLSKNCSMYRPKAKRQTTRSIFELDP